MRLKRTYILSLLAIGLAGCSHYYQIRDPSNGSVFYTTRYESEANGVTRFVNAGTREYVSLHESEITRIDKNKFHEATTLHPTEPPK